MKYLARSAQDICQPTIPASPKALSTISEGSGTTLAGTAVKTTAFDWYVTSHISAHRFDRSAAQAEVVDLQEMYNKDVESAVAWLKEQKWADAQHIAMTGISFGGIQTLLTAEKGLGIKAFLEFAPAAQSWNPVLADRLRRAVRQASAPIFVIQARNDYSVEPSKVLGAELAWKGPPNEAKIYPSFGRTAQDGHWVFASRRDGIGFWSADVDTFLATMH